MQLWDTAGQERFRKITQSYYKGATGVVIVYDSTDRKSFDRISAWIKEIDNHANKDICKVLVASKTDCDKKEVSVSDGQFLAKKYGCEFYETSAKDSYVSCFDSMAENMVKKNCNEITNDDRFALEPCESSKYIARNKKSRI